MAGNVIGTGAVVLSASADELLTGLNKAEKATDKWAGNTTKKANAVADANRKAYDSLVSRGHKLADYRPDVDYSKPMGGAGKDKGKEGEKGGALGALSAGGIAGIAAGATLKGLDMLAGLPDMLKSLREGSGQRAGGPLDRMIASVETFQKLGTQLLATVISPMTPAFERAAEIAKGFFDRLQPIAAVLSDQLGGLLFSALEMLGSYANLQITSFEPVVPLLKAVGEWLEVTVFLFETLFTLAVDGFAEVVKWMGEWLNSWVDLGGMARDMSQQLFANLKMVAEGAGYLWDVFKFGAGAVAKSLGTVIEVALKLVLRSFREVVSLAQRLPDYMRPSWLDGFIGALDRADSAVTGIGSRMEQWGRDAQKGFGQSAGIFGAAIDSLHAKYDARQKRIANAAHKVEQKVTEVKLAPAMLRGSVEAYSTIARWEAGNMVTGQSSTNDPIKIAKEQLNATRDVKRLLTKLVDRTDRTIPIEIIP